MHYGQKESSSEHGVLLHLSFTWDRISRMETLLQKLLKQSANRPWLFWLLLSLQPYREATQCENGDIDMSYMY